MIPGNLEACKYCELMECDPDCPIAIDLRADVECDRLLEAEDER